MLPLAVYVHIPFCVRKCAYCDFLSFPLHGREGADELQRRYFDALRAEAAAVSGELADSGYQVRSIYFGGGTPSVADSGEIISVLELLRRRFTVARDAEVTLECNPGTATAAGLRILRDAGINRLSIGVQSFENEELALLGRIHTAADALSCYEDARSAGFRFINIDLMAALPGQTKETLLKSINQAIRLAPEHLSLYSLIIEPGTPFYERYADEVPDPHHDCAAGRKNRDPSPRDPADKHLPDEDEEREMMHASWDALRKAGYERYEISNFARSPELRCAQNLTYWQRTDYLGIGLGAASLIGNTRYTNTRSLQVYLDDLTGGSSGRTIRENTEHLDAASQMEEFMFLGLRMTEGISERRFLETFHTEIGEIYGAVLEKNILDGLLARRADRIFLTERGTDLANYVMAQFLLDH